MPIARVQRVSLTGRPPVRGLGGLEAAEALVWARRLEGAARPCGCKSGAGLASVCLVVWPVWIAVSGAPRAWSGIVVALVTYIAVVVGGGVVGKVAGIAVGRLRYHRLRRQLARRVAVGVD